MGRIPPTADQAELLETAQECYCCNCMVCDYGIGTITVTFSGTFSMEQEVESDTDPGYYDRITYSGTWSVSKVFTQEKYDGGGATYGYFQWNNGATYDVPTGECQCADRGEWGGFNGVSSYWINTTTTFRLLRVAVEDPTNILFDEDVTADIEIGVYNIFSALPKGVGWVNAGSASRPLFNGYFLMQGDGGYSPPLWWQEFDGIDLACQHPRGTFTQTFDDDYNVVYNANEFDDWQHAFSVTVEIGGNGSMRNCEAAPISYV